MEFNELWSWKMYDSTNILYLGNSFTIIKMRKMPSGRLVKWYKSLTLIRIRKHIR